MLKQRTRCLRISGLIQKGGILQLSHSKRSWSENFWLENRNSFRPKLLLLSRTQQTSQLSGNSLKALEVSLGIWDTCSALRFSFPAKLPWSQESWELPAKVYCQSCIPLSSLFHWAGVDPAELLEISSVFHCFACFNMHHISKQQHFFQTEIQNFRQLCS